MVKHNSLPKERLLSIRIDVRIWRSLALLLVILIYAGCSPLKRFAYEGINRDEWQLPEQVIQSLDIQKGDLIADLGSGSGYFTVLLAPAVGPTGKVYAVDVDPDMNEYLSKRINNEGHSNIEIILAEYHDPLLPESGVDLIFTSNTYHHIGNRVSYFANVKKYLRPNGRIAIIEGNGQGWFYEYFGHWTPKENIRKEMQEAGYNLDKEFNFLSKQHYLVFTPGKP